MFTRRLHLISSLCSVAVLVLSASATADEFRFDCGTGNSPVMEGFNRLTADEVYDASRGYGWLGGRPTHVEFRRPVRNMRLRGSLSDQLLQEAYDNHRNPLNRDGVMSRQDIGFRLDVPDGVYRVGVTLGSLTNAIGSIDLSVNNELVAEQLAVWAPGGYRMLDRTPAGWWTRYRTTVDVTDGVIRIDWKKNQQHYDAQMAEQATWETPYAQWYHSTPVLQDPPYHYIGYPFAGHSIMAIEVTSYRPGPVELVDGKLRLTARIESSALQNAIDQFNQQDFDAAVASLKDVREREAQVGKAVSLCGWPVASRRRSSRKSCPGQSRRCAPTSTRTPTSSVSPRSCPTPRSSTRRCRYTLTEEVAPKATTS
jgi:hypothetical protein